MNAAATKQIRSVTQGAVQSDTETKDSHDCAFKAR